MPSRPKGSSRRALLNAVLVLPLAGCAATVAPPVDVVAPQPVPEARRDTTADDAHFAELERTYAARLGVYVSNAAGDPGIAYRADERFAFCSTFKTLAAAAVLQRNPLSHLDTMVTYTRADIDSFSPVTRENVDTGMTIRQLCDAAIRYSDGTAGNLLVRDIGGPPQLTEYLRSIGDQVSRMDDLEPELNRVPPGDVRDTTTPRAIAEDYRRIVLGDALTADRSGLVRDWLTRTTTGGRRIRAAVPAGWTVADKTGTGDYGRANDVAILWPPAAEPLVLSIMSDRVGYDADTQEKMLADAARYVLSVSSS